MLRIIVCLLGSLPLALSEINFDSSIPETVKGIIGQPLSVPCIVRGNFPHQGFHVIWKDKEGFQIYDDSWEAFYTTRISDKIILLNFGILEEKDLGIYQCQVMDSFTEYENKKMDFTITLLNETKGLKWDTTYQCGPGHLIDGEPAECDPDGPFPCCNADGKCDYPPVGCACPTCIDFRKNNTGIMFDKLSPVKARGEVGKLVDIPCAVRYTYFDVDDEGAPKIEMIWKRSKVDSENSEELVVSGGNVTDQYADKISTRYNKTMKTYYMTIHKLEKEDEGTYHCSFHYEDKLHSKDIKLSVFDYIGKESNDNKTVMSITPFSFNGSCGDGVRFRPEITNSATLHRGKFMSRPCDPESGTPCCGSNKTCGFTAEYCLCEGCVDNRVYDPTKGICGPKLFSCSNFQCINYYSQCDGKNDCYEGEDEQNCDVQGQFEEVQTFLVAQIGKSYSLPCKFSNLGEDEEIKLTSTYLNGVREVETHSNKFGVRYLYISNVQESRSYTWEIRNSRGGVRFEFIEIKVCKEENAVLCVEDSKCISKSQVCDGVANCIFGSDEDNCTRADEVPDPKCYNTEDCTSPHSMVGGKCIMTSEEPMNWFEAETFCRENQTKLFSFNSLGEIITFVKDAKMKVGSKFPAWSGIQGNVDWMDNIGSKKSSTLFHPESVHACAYLASTNHTYLNRATHCTNEMYAVCERKLCDCNDML